MYADDHIYEDDYRYWRLVVWDYNVLWLFIYSLVPQGKHLTWFCKENTVRCLVVHYLSSLTLCILDSQCCNAITLVVDDIFDFNCVLSDLFDYQRYETSEFVVWMKNHVPNNRACAHAHTHTHTSYMYIGSSYIWRDRNAPIVLLCIWSFRWKFDPK